MEVDAVAVAEDAVEDAVGDCELADRHGPLRYRDLTGDQAGPVFVTLSAISGRSRRFSADKPRNLRASKASMKTLARRCIDSWTA
ncbi:MAG: hypothetical protein OXI22_04970 [Defluviicoccus sp.]|nr:hypothetical protein [Defluviicoccus sp.]MDE0383215.1 hypothetical protein [Defluviicoccus sp.]